MTAEILRDKPLKQEHDWTKSQMISSWYCTGDRKKEGEREKREGEREEGGRNQNNSELIKFKVSGSKWFYSNNVHESVIVSLWMIFRKSCISIAPVIGCIITFGRTVGC